MATADELWRKLSDIELAAMAASAAVEDLQQHIDERFDRLEALLRAAGQSPEVAP